MSVHGQHLIYTGESHLQELFCFGYGQAQVQWNRLRHIAGPARIEQAAMIDLPPTQHPPAKFLAGQSLASNYIERPYKIQPYQFK